MSAPLLADPSLSSGGSAWPWVVIALLGAWHGLNPGMGWLFAAALGMQEKKGSAAWRALPPLALGHALAVAAAVGVALALGWVTSPGVVRWATAGALVGYGAFRLVRRGHPRFGGMRVGARDLTIWSALMATAHGAGLMVVPFLARADEGGRGAAAAARDAAGHARHLAGHGAPAPPGAGADGVMTASLLPAEWVDLLVAVFVHTGAYLLVTGLLAVLVVSWWGLRLLRSLWIDIDRVWAAALVLTGVLTLVLGAG